MREPSVAYNEAANGLSHSRTGAPAVSNTTPSPVRSVTRSLEPDMGNSDGTGNSGIGDGADDVKVSVERNEPAVGRIRGHEYRPTRAAAKRPRNSSV